MMNSHEQMMCEMQAYFFALSRDSFLCGSSFFISRFMNSELAKDLDNIDDPYNYISPNNSIKIMRESFPSLNLKEGDKYSIEVLKWIGYIYRAWAIIKKKSSSSLYKSFKSNQLLPLFDSFHTFSIEYCIDRLEELINEQKGNQLSDYEIYKAIKENRSV